jgi:hypothetical protein
MTATETTKTANVFQRWRALDVVRRRLGSRRALAAVAILVAAGVAIAAAANWSWLVATGIASVLFSVLPCLVMCGLGLCMHKLSGGAGATTTKSAATDGSADPASVASGSLASGDLSCCSEARHPDPVIVPTKDASIQPKEKNDA